MLASLDSGLMVLGETVRRTLYTVIENEYRIGRERLPDNLEVFHQVLEHLFGRAAIVIERQVAKSLYARMGMEFLPRGEWTLVEYFDHIKKREECPSPGDSPDNKIQ
jgi:hypothetical protein